MTQEEKDELRKNISDKMRNIKNATVEYDNIMKKHYSFCSEEQD